jgi:hypothetical protein
MKGAPARFSVEPRPSGARDRGVVEALGNFAASCLRGVASVVLLLLAVAGMILLFSALYVLVARSAA